MNRGFDRCTSFGLLWSLCVVTPNVIAQSAPQAATTSSSPSHSGQIRTLTLEGTWSGSLQAGDTILHFALHIAKDDRGALAATLDSLDQGVYGIEAGSLRYTQATIKFHVFSVNAAYEGEISSDQRAIEGTWSQGGANLQLIFRRQPRVLVYRSPPGAVASSEGTWQGALETNGMRYRLQLRISHDAQGQLVAAMDSIDQGINGFRASQVTQSETAIHLDLPAIRGIYDGNISSVTNSISGTWRQNGDSTPLTFKRSDQILELRRPQNPKKPYPYGEEEVAIPNAAAGITLAATLTVPRGRGAFPAAVLVAGSGPLNRDASDSGHRSFLVLADYLTRQGIAVLRYDKRGIGKSTGAYEQATTADFAGDAESALLFLKGRKEVDVRNIGIIGHSEGGIIAPMIAARSHDLAWIVMLAGPATKGEETLLLQSDLITRAAGMTGEQVAKSLDFDRNSYNLVRNERDRATLETNCKTW